MIRHRQYMDIASIISKSSYALRLKVGCILVKHGNIIAMGYNGTPYGFDNMCESDESTTKPTVIHAEENALIKCARNGINAEGAACYVTTLCCPHCAALMVQAGIKEVYYETEYRLADAVDIFLRAGIKLQKIPDEI